MSEYRTKNKLFLFGVESSSGVEESLVVGSNAIKVATPEYNPNFDVLNPEEVANSLDMPGVLSGGGFMGMTAGVWARGAGTPGTAPEYGPLLRSCSMSETLTASDIDDTAQAGATGTITLAAGASSTDDIYIGMVLATTGGTGDGQKRVITDYDGTTKVASVYPNWDTDPDNTTTYTIYANALYVPVSESLETGTGYLYENAVGSSDSRLWKLVGGASNMVLAITTRQVPRFDFTIRGQLPAAPTNVTKPGDPTYSDPRGEAFKNARAYLGGAAIKFRTLSLDLGADVQQADDPSEAFGYDVAGVTEREITGSVNPLLELLSVRNAFQDFQDRTEQKLWLDWGQTAGNRLSVYCPAIQYNAAPQPADTDGFTAETLGFKANGFDTGVYLCIY